VTVPHVQKAIDDAIPPARVADLVADAVVAGRFWVFTEQPFVDLCVSRWQSIADGANPETDIDVPGLPPAAQLREEVQRLLGIALPEA
jgi:hypothetical protein